MSQQEVFFERESYHTKTDLSLPFNGIWQVGNGGRSPDKNNHFKEDGSGPLGQVFAYDFRKPHKNEGLLLEDYEAFGEPVTAPGDGIIVQIIDGCQDMQIGNKDRYVITGNCIVLDHQNGEWSVIAHFKYNSIQVKVGDKVNKGDRLGLCGNTGNTSEPHIHYHLQDEADINKAKGLPAIFREISKNGQTEKDADPERFDEVSNL